VIEVGAVVNGSNFAGGTSKDLGLPGIAAVTLLAPLITIDEYLEDTRDSLTDGCQNE
jgi:hypothetical protein